MREQIRKDYPTLYPRRMVEREKAIDAKYNFFGANPDKRDHWSTGMNLKVKADILYFAGCYASYQQWETAQAVVRVLRSAGEDVMTLGKDERCCGQLAGWAGNWALEEKMARHNVERIKASGVRRVVFSCAECYRTFKIDYPEMVGDLPFEVAHVVELYDQLIREGKLRLTQEMRQSVTYHDPCYLIRQHLGRGKDIYEQPRFVIKSVPGIELREMGLNRRFAYCCGAGGGVTNEAFPEASAWFAQQRVRQASEVSEVMITACPRCQELFKRAVRETGGSVKVTDISQFLAQAAGM
jgi:heterodisulfide reductase subunit D